jgi:hypothetical protein
MKRIALAIAAAIAVLAALAAPAGASTLPASAPLVQCQDWQDGVGMSIIVSRPSMSPLGNLYIAPDGGLHVNPDQTVAYRVSIYRTVGSGVALYSQGPWMATSADWNIDTSNSAWLNLSTNQWEYSGRRYWVHQPGVYKIWVNYYWYANEAFGAASDAGWVPAWSISGTSVAGACRF